MRSAVDAGPLTLRRGNLCVEVAAAHWESFHNRGAVALVRRDRGVRVVPLADVVAGAFAV
jgi:hypothetical protein